jgi:ABC-type sugar transport system, permease component
MNATATVSGTAPAENRSAVEPRGPRPKPFFTPKKIMIYTTLVFFSLYFLFPLYVMVTTSFKTMPEIRFGSIFALPNHFRAAQPDQF